MSAEPGRPPQSMRFKGRAWTRVDWALAAICALLVYGTLFKGHGIYVFPLSLWLAANNKLEVDNPEAMRMPAKNNAGQTHVPID